MRFVKQRIEPLCRAGPTWSRFQTALDISAIFAKDTPRLALRQFFFIFLVANQWIYLGALKCLWGRDFG